MAWWDNELLKKPRNRSDRYKVAFPDEYAKEEVDAAQKRIDQQEERKRQES
jgi:hypothetical protein